MGILTGRRLQSNRLDDNGRLALVTEALKFPHQLIALPSGNDLTVRTVHRCSDADTNSVFLVLRRSNTSYSSMFHAHSQKSQSRPSINKAPIALRMWR